MHKEQTANFLMKKQTGIEFKSILRMRNTRKSAVLINKPKSGNMVPTLDELSLPCSYQSTCLVIFLLYLSHFYTDFMDHAQCCFDLLHSLRLSIWASEKRFITKTYLINIIYSQWFSPSLHIPTISTYLLLLPYIPLPTSSLPFSLSRHHL